jgi:nucleoside-diphosphate-sugar epimerase
MDILLTGGSGVVGRRAIPVMISLGHRVTAAGRSPARLEALRRMGASTLALDLFDPTAVREAVRGHDAVVNLATHIPSGARAFLPRAWSETDRLRRDASAILVDAAIAAGVKRFVQESFAPVYPDSGDRWIDESTPIRPARYNRTVADAEASATRFTRAGGVGVILRFALLYGSHDRPTQEILRVIKHGWMPVLGRPESYVSMVSHPDAASAVVAGLGLPAGAYNVVDDEPPTRRELGEGLAALLGVAPPKFLPTWIATLGGSLGQTIARSLRVSNGELKRASRWSPQYANTIDGFRDALHDE